MGEWWSVLIVVRTLQGKDGEPVFLFVDGHSSRWPLRALRHLQDHNVFCIVLPSHTTIWSQPNDAAANVAATTGGSRGQQRWRRGRRQQ